MVSSVTQLDCTNGIFGCQGKNNFAQDSWDAKTELRELFRKSPNWNESLQAIVIKSTRKHTPNYNLISDWMFDIISPLKTNDEDKWCDASGAIRFFFNPEGDSKKYHLEKLNKIAPKAYHEGKKPSKIFKALCDALGVTDNTKGSKFQKLFAKISDELSEKTVAFKLYVSINPAHFLTMSNPKKDKRGDTMVSCHSFNSTEYDYNCGCTGYARDKYTFIVFTAADDNNPETLNNRKTSRQIFAYMPNNGVLLQSRMYTTNSGGSYGGVNGDTPEGKIYRALIQKEISELENAQNLWETENYYDNQFGIKIRAGIGFGGYTDWTHYDMGAKISVRTDSKEFFRNFEVGTFGLCIKCGKETMHGLFCNDCDAKRPYCDECQNHCESVREVRGRDGSPITVCADCFRRYYRLCAHCGEYHHYSDITEVASGELVCEDCLRDHYTQCECCGEYYLNSEVQDLIDDNGDTISACEDCRNSENCERHQECEHCGRRFPYRELTQVAGGGYVCQNCLEYHYDVCDECGEYYPYDEMEHFAVDRNGDEITICEICREGLCRVRRVRAFCSP